MHGHLALIISSVMLLGALIQWFSWWVRVPAILGLLVAGIVLGPVTGVVNPDALFGDSLFTFISLGVAIVLFEGALTLRFSEIKGHGQSVTNLVTWGAVMSWLLMGAGIHYLTELSWSIALLFSALVVVTGPTVIMPLLRTVKPNQSVSQILRWEGILIDPLGALFAVFVFEFMIFGVGSHSLSVFMQELANGIVCGGIGALVVIYILKHHLLPEFLHNVFVLSVVLTVFSLSNFFGEEAGLVAVTVMGVWLANTKHTLDLKDILGFKETLSFIIISILFIFLAARIQFSELLAIAPLAIPVLLVVLLVRPIVVVLSTWNSSLTWKEKAFVSWVAPRGIVAAAVSSLFALRLQENDYPNAELLPALTFMVIVVTVFIQSVSARWVAKLLDVVEEDSKGVLFIGANNFIRELAKVLKNLGVDVMLTSMTTSDVRKARLEGFKCYLGNPASVHADQNLELSGLGQMVAMSRRPEINATSSNKFLSEFGHENVYSLSDEYIEGDLNDSRLSPGKSSAKILMDRELTLSRLLYFQMQGGVIKATTITDEFTFEHYNNHYQQRVIPLLTIDTNKNIHWVLAGEELEAVDNMTIVSIIFPEGYTLLS